MRRLMIAAALVVTLAGCSTGGGGAASPTITPSSRSAPAPTTVVATTVAPRYTLGEQQFLATYVSADPAAALSGGRWICASAIAGIDRQTLIKTMPQIPAASANKAIDAATTYLCPGAVVAAAPAGPATTIASVGGVYEVGVDIVAGKWKAPGEGKCYWSRKTNDDSQDIIDNHYQAGPAAVVLKSGELFETQNCGTWQHQP
jgi:hypothetical protein